MYMKPGPARSGTAAGDAQPAAAARDMSRELRAKNNWHSAVPVLRRCNWVFAAHASTYHIHPPRARQSIASIPALAPLCTT